MFKHIMMTALFVLLAGLAVTACVAPTPVADQPAPAATVEALPVETAASAAPGDEPMTGNASPAEVTAAFYTWYLDYIGATGSEDMRNPLVDGAYRASPYLTQSFIGHIDELLAEMRAQDRGGYDPFLLAQDIPQDFSVDPGVAPGTAVVHLLFGPDSVRHLLVTMDDSGRKIAAIAENAGLVDAAPAGQGLGGGEAPLEAGEDYGFSFSYPAGWVLQAQPMGGPGMPEDWPVQALWLLMPQEVADTLASRSGQPDPTAPIIVAPFQIEVVVGDTQAMERVYYNFNQGEPATIGNHEADTWIVVTDWVTEFPGREAQAAVAAPVLPELLASFVFTQ